MERKATPGAFTDQLGINPEEAGSITDTELFCRMLRQFEPDTMDDLSRDQDLANDETDAEIWNALFDTLYDRYAPLFCILTRDPLIQPLEHAPWGFYPFADELIYMIEAERVRLLEAGDVIHPREDEEEPSYYLVHLQKHEYRLVTATHPSHFVWTFDFQIPIEEWLERENESPGNCSVYPVGVVLETKMRRLIHPAFYSERLGLLDRYWTDSIEKVVRIAVCFRGERREQLCPTCMKWFLDGDCSCSGCARRPI